MHFARLQKNGDVGPVRRLRAPKGSAPEVKFWSKVERAGDDECWEWIGSRNAKGYGKGKIDGQWVSPHRFSYELHVGPIPEGLEIDHLCRNTGCVNPAHLEPVTREENMRRRKEAMTHCRKGHEFTPENTNYHSVSGARVCKICQRENGRRNMRLRRARLKAAR